MLSELVDDGLEELSELEKGDEASERTSIPITTCCHVLSPRNLAQIFFNKFMLFNIEQELMDSYGFEHFS